ncbi:MAG: hypothetical protein H6738_18250 [Alphaproteobacteria bacterium]|nr:hypothetical protein [Alphaproteobacteria bacterium]
MEATDERLLHRIEEDEGAHRRELLRIARSQPTLMSWLTEQAGEGSRGRKLAGVARYQVAVVLRVSELRGQRAAAVDLPMLESAEAVVARAAEMGVGDEGSFVDRATRLPKSRPALLDAMLHGMFAPGPSVLDETDKARAWVLVWVAVEALELAGRQR